LVLAYHPNIRRGGHDRPSSKSAVDEAYYHAYTPKKNGRHESNVALVLGERERKDYHTDFSTTVLGFTILSLTGHLASISCKNASFSLSLMSASIFTCATMF